MKTTTTTAGTDIYGGTWGRKSADEIAQMGYDERKAYEAKRRAEMSAAGVTSAHLAETPAQMHKRLAGKL